MGVRSSQTKPGRWIPLIVGVAVTVGFGLVVGLFGGSDREAAPPTTPPSFVSAAPEETTTTPPGPTVQPSTTTAPETRAQSSWRGVLLDGTKYTLHFDQPGFAEPEAIHGVVMLDKADGTSAAAGLLTLAPGRARESSVRGPEISIPAGEWTATFRTYVEIADELAAAIPGPPLDAFTEILTPSGLPALELTPPLRWATDDEVPSAMAVDYGWFAIRRGCPVEALACSGTGAVSVMAGIDDGDSPDLRGIFVDSDAPRPLNDPSYLNPGPLSPRVQHQVMWTGSEMIVYGGRLRESQGANALTDGAAYDPATENWRMIAPYETAPGSDADTRAVWADTTMLVIGRSGLVAYDPNDDSWAEIGPGLTAPRQAVWSSDRLWVWALDGIHVASPGEEWRRLPDLGVGSWREWEGYLMASDEGIVVSALTGEVCHGRIIASTTGDEWSMERAPILTTDEYADCSLANQAGVVGGQLVIWDSADHPSAVRIGDEWTLLAGAPVIALEGVGGSVAIGDRLLAPVGDTSAIYDPATVSWIGPIRVHGTVASTMVWTGDELLAWSGSCCGVTSRDTDAWRWTPPANGS